MLVAEEEQARKIFAAKLALTNGCLVVAEKKPFIIGNPELVDFDVAMPDGSVYALRDVPCAAFRMATRSEFVRLGRWLLQLLLIAPNLGVFGNYNGF